MRLIHVLVGLVGVAVIAATATGVFVRDPHPHWNTYHLGWFIGRRAHHVSITMDAWNVNYQVTGYDDSSRVIWFRAGVPSVTVDLGKP